MKKIRIPYLKIILTFAAIFLPFTYWHTKYESSKISQKNNRNHAKKLFVVTGENSGDRLGAWFVRQYKTQHPQSPIVAIGGNFLKETRNVSIFKDFREVKQEFYIANGFWPLIRNLPTHLSLVNSLLKHIQENQYTDVLLVDYPFINIPLARTIKNNLPHVTVTYLAPPELWFWGRWGIDHALKSYCDNIIVLYPHEVEWYKKINVPVSWLGYPFYDDFKPYINQHNEKKHCIALLPGSRASELKVMMPLLGEVVKTFHKKYPSVHFVLPLAESLKSDALEYYLKRYQIEQVVKIVKKDKLKALSQCCLAISKPGTVTLDLALLGVPTIVAYKTSWPMYVALNLLVRPTYISLPNLLENKQIFKELAQSNCNHIKILHDLETLYTSFCEQSNQYKATMQALKKFQHTFDETWHKKTKES